MAFRPPAALWAVLLAPFVGLAAILVEYLTGILLLYLRTRKLVTRATVHGSYAVAAQVEVLDIVSVLAVVVGEELILRQLLFRLLAGDLALALWAVIPLCAVAYAANHLSFGLASAIAKLPSGLLYVLLFYVSGLSVLVVVIAHATQNLTLLAWSRLRS